MTRQSLIDFLGCNEPWFDYKGQQYGICTPSKVVFWKIGDDESEQIFDSIEALVDTLAIDGVSFFNIAQEAFQDYGLD